MRPPHKGPAGDLPGICILCPFSSPSEHQEEHHVVGRNNDAGLTAPLCITHHREQHERLRESGASMKAADNRLDWMISVLLALGTFFHALACFQWVGVLCGFRDDLDHHCPGWRHLSKRK
jgi:hypothetical protein